MAAERLEALRIKLPIILNLFTMNRWGCLLQAAVMGKKGGITCEQKPASLFDKRL
jgi:hypothetical protein